MRLRSLFFVERRRILLGAASAILAATTTVKATEESAAGRNIVIPPILVGAAGPDEGLANAFATLATREPNTVSIVGRTTIDQIGGPGESNVLTALRLLPSVNGEFADPYGLSPNQTFRIRGQNEWHLGRNLDDLPINGVIGGGGDFIDLENVDAIQLYRGAIPTDKGFGFSNATGLINLSLARPRNTLGLQTEYNTGSFGLQRGFLRFDSGLLASGTKLFLSSSFTHADKWRGAGNAPDGRTNVMLGISQSLGSSADLDFFYIHNRYRANDYRALSYAQTTNLGSNASFDYPTSLTGDPTMDHYYYKFQRWDLTDDVLFAEFAARPTADSKITIKPYYWHEDHERSFAVGPSFLISWQVPQEKYGLVAQYDLKLDPVTLTFGNWFENAPQSFPPSVWEKLYDVQPNGSQTFFGWNLLTKQGERRFDQPYVALKADLGPATITAGLKEYIQWTPSEILYQTSGVPNGSYDSVIRTNLAPIATGTARGQTITELLPNFGVSYEFIKGLVGHVNYGRNYGQPSWGALIGQYNGQLSRFQAAGLTLQSLYDKSHLEVSDNIDLGLRLFSNWWYVAPTVYFAHYNHKEAAVVDPVAGLSYYQSTTGAKSHGVELEMGIQPLDGLSIYSSFGWNSFTFDDNLVGAGGSMIAAKGKQITDSPKYLFSVGAQYQSGPWQANGSLRYVGSRFGDLQNTQKIDAYTVVDLGLSYSLRELTSQDIRISLNVFNLLNERHISVVNFYEGNGAGGASYYVGSPRTAALSVKAQF